MGNIKWRYKISPLSVAKEIIISNPDCHIDVSLGSKAGYHIMNGSVVLCRISRASFNALTDGLTDTQPIFINQATYRVKKLTNSTMDKKGGGIKTRGGNPRMS